MVATPTHSKNNKLLPRDYYAPAYRAPYFAPFPSVCLQKGDVVSKLVVDIVEGFIRMRDGHDARFPHHTCFGNSKRKWKYHTGGPRKLCNILPL